jgi:hypothetical protein
MPKKTSKKEDENDDPLFRVSYAKRKNRHY